MIMIMKTIIIIIIIIMIILIIIKSLFNTQHEKKVNAKKLLKSLPRVIYNSKNRNK